MFAEYLKETGGVEILSTEGGFLAYQILDKQFYISDFFLLPEFRGASKNFKKIFTLAYSLAKEKGCEYFACHLQFKSKLFNEHLLTYLKLGFKIVLLEPSRVSMVTPIEGFKWVDVPPHK